MTLGKSIRERLSMLILHRGGRPLEPTLELQINFSNELVGDLADTDGGSPLLAAGSATFAQKRGGYGGSQTGFGKRCSRNKLQAYFHKEIWERDSIPLGRPLDSNPTFCPRHCQVFSSN